VYLKANNFKGRNPDGEIEHRILHVPAPSEALAEAALLTSCAATRGMANPPCVFSYGLLRSSQATSSFEPYMKCIRRRQVAIAAACREHPKGEVQYLDIRRFYPSIKIEDAGRAWERYSAELEPLTRTLGRSLLDHHSEANDGKLLTGPMLSHLIGNLLLRSMDEDLSGSGDVRYFRYVDDIVLVGGKQHVRETRLRIQGRLRELGLELHGEESDKWLNVAPSKWLEGEHDFAEREEPISWKTLIGGLKWLLVEKPGSHETIRVAFANQGFRIPILDYGAAVREQPYVTRLSEIVRRRWFWGRRKTLVELLAQAAALRTLDIAQLDEVLGTLERVDGYHRKRLLSKARYLCGRVTYLATHFQLGILGERLRNVPELEFHATVFKAVAEGDVSEPLRLGADVAQAVAQPLRAERRTVTVQGPLETDAELRGLAILGMNGVPVVGKGLVREERDELLEISATGVRVEHFKSQTPFVRTFASLHGLTDELRHSAMLETAFHASDAMAFDAVSSYMHDS
jgi:hypothetical protein